ncbi:MAG: nucleoside diphosphate kinase regulator [Thermoguttaceae bacterium]
MKLQTVFITDSDRRRLGTMLNDIHLTFEDHSHLDALEAGLELAQVLDSEEIPEDVVTMNSTVEIFDLDSGEAETYTVVYPRDADIATDRISVLAPVGRALLGKRVGDVIRVAVPSGQRRIRIEAIRFQPERADAYHL